MNNLKSKMTEATMRISFALVLALGFASFTNHALAEIKTETITYKDGDVTLKGMMAWDDAISGKRPGVLVIGEWWGINDANKDRARRFAAAGYVAFAPDMYGDGIITKDPKMAGELMNSVIGDVKVWRQRAQAGLDILKADPNVDGSKLAAMGSSFGGGTAVQMAYAGHDIKAAICIASIQCKQPVPEDVTSVKPRILVFHARNDVWVKQDMINAFMDSLDRVKADWELITYSGAVHSFATPGSDSYGIDNMAYNEMADKRSWAAMMSLLEDLFN